MSITADELNIMLTRPFATRAEIPGLVQDELARRMRAGVPKRLRPKGYVPVLTGSNIRQIESGRARRNRLVPEITRLVHNGKGIVAIARNLGISVSTVGRTMAENSIMAQTGR